MIILGIETSCDETSASIVKDGVDVISQVISSSSELHIKTGGIVPENAARAQVEYIVEVLTVCIKKAQIEPGEIDAIAVTVGPGLIGSLLVGVETAKVLSFIWERPVIGVNHLVGHIYANFVNSDKNHSVGLPEFPALALVVSGGHTDLVIMKDHGSLESIGSTRDDAAGEAFDKCARILGLPYPGGPSISRAADKYLERVGGNTKLNLFPRPLSKQEGFDFSFSGLKTSVYNYVNNGEGVDTEKMAAEVQEAIVDSLTKKTQKAIEKYSPKSFLLSGGVAANTRLNDRFIEIFENKHKNVSFHRQCRYDRIGCFFCRQAY
jgi:N6-L-threonylcarbamoyladenine synthase